MPERGDDAVRRVDEMLAEIARDTGGTLHNYPRPGEAVRRRVLRDERNDAGTQYLVAQVEADGTVRVIGHDHGPGVTAFFGSGITSYEWVYVIAPDRVATLVTELGGLGDDVLDVLAAHTAAGTRLDPVLRGPSVGAQFDSWPS
jgi:hypothetical protein